MIEIIKNAISKDGVPVTFPVDASGSQSVMLVGLRSDNEAMAPVRVNAAGKLMVDSSVTVDGLDLGAVGLTAMDAAGVVGPINRLQNPGLPITSSLMALDPRLKFSAGSSNLKTLSMGDFGGNDVPLSVDAAGKLNVVVSSAATTPVTLPDSMFAAQTIGATLDAYTALLTMNCAKLLNKTIVVKNTAVANLAEVKIMASVDGGTTYDVPVINDVEVGPGISLVFTHNTAVTHIQVLLRSKVAGTPATVTAKAYAIGA